MILERGHRQSYPREGGTGVILERGHRQSYPREGGTGVILERGYRQCFDAPSPRWDVERL